MITWQTQKLTLRYLPLHALLKKALLVFFIIPFFLGSPALGSEHIERKKILVLFSFRPTLPVASQWDQGIRSVFEADNTLKSVINIEHLDLTHVNDERHIQLLLELYRLKYSSPKPDLIIPVLNASVDLMLKYGEDLFPGVPILFGGVEKQFFDGRSLRSNITGHLTDIDYTDTLELALNLHPDTRNIAVVAGAGQIVRRWTNNCRKAYEAYEDRFDFTWLTGLPMETLLEKVGNLPPQTIVISLPVLLDGAGKEFVGIESLAQVVHASNAPVYTFWDVNIGTGVVGGYMSSFRQEAESVARLGLRILKGEKPEDIPLTQAPKFAYMFDWRQLKRWAIPESSLPPGSIVQFKELTMWDKHKGRIIGAVALIIFQGLLILYLLYQRRVRLQAEEETLQSKQDYKTVADYTYDWEYWGNSDGTFRYVSPACERISGYSVRDFMNNPSLLKDIIKLEDRTIWDDHEHHRNSRKEPSSIRIEFRIQRKDGEFRWIEHACQPVFDSQGNEQGFRASNRDVTLRKESELEIKRLKKRLEAESAYLQEEIKLVHNFDNIIGQSEEINYILHRVEQVASMDSPVLILGETGTGKELIARAIHQISTRNKRALLKVNCAALPSNLIENELFGHEKGAYTGAGNSRLGRFEIARGSTLFMDEIGEIPLELQAKLLRVLESGEFERLGNPKTLHSDARIITSTNRNLEDEVANGRFREDLLYRLNVFTITAPPLRKRTADIPLLAQWFIDQFSKKMGKPAPVISKHTIQSMQNYHWPGNVRELEHTIESALITNRGEKLQIELTKTSENPISRIRPFVEMERDYILQILEAKNWKIGGLDGAASALDMHVNTLRSRMKKLGIKRPKEL